MYLSVDTLLVQRFLINYTKKRRIFFREHMAKNVGVAGYVEAF